MIEDKARHCIGILINSVYKYPYECGRLSVKGIIPDINLSSGYFSKTNCI